MGFDNVNVNVSGPVQPTSTYKTKVLKGNHSFASQVTEPNMKYVIKHDFDLGGESVTIPEGCLLEFDGGYISNGTLVGQNTILIYNQELDTIFHTVTRQGTFVYNNTVSADEEDITEVGNLLKLKDRGTADGMGKIILRKNKTFAEQLTQENTIYVIQYDFDLNGEDITVPANCVLEFDGGSLTNGVLYSNNCLLTGQVKLYCDINGSFLNNEVHIDWFSSDTYISDSLNMLCDGTYNRRIIFGNKSYNINKKVLINGNVNLIGVKGTKINLLIPQEKTYNANLVWVFGNTLKYSGTISDIEFIIPENNDEYINDPLRIGSAENISFVNCIFNQIGHYYNSFVCRKNNAHFSVLNAGGKNYLFDNCYFKLAGVDGVESIGLANGAENIVIRNCKFENMTDDLGIHNCKHIFIHDNELYSYDGRIYCSDSEDIHIYNNKLKYTHQSYTGMGIVVLKEVENADYNKDIYIYDNVVDYTDAANSPAYGIRVLGQNIFIYNNILISKISNDNSYGGSLFVEDEENYPTGNIDIFNNNCRVIQVFYSITEGVRVFGNNAVFITCNPSLLLMGNIKKNSHVIGSSVYRPNLNANRVDNNGFIFYPYFDTTLKKPIIFIPSRGWRSYNGEDADLPTQGSIQDFKPANIVGTSVFDNENKRPAFWDGNNYVTANGEDCTVKGTGATTERPAWAKLGFRYYDTDISKSVYLKNYGTVGEVRFFFENLPTSTGDMVLTMFGKPFTLNLTQADLDTINSGSSDTMKRGYLLGVLINKLAFFGITARASNPTLYVTSLVSGLIRDKLSWNFGNTGITISNTVYITLGTDNIWAEYDGATAGVNRNGTFAEKPTAANIYVGFKYFCTDKQTAEGATNGIEIIHKGNDVWVDALGRVVS